MITEFKIFENNNNHKYNVGDYIFLAESDDDSVESDAKIIKLHNYGNRNSYDISVFSSDGELIETYVFDEEIERLLTQEEIELFELKIKASKYNL